MSETPKAVFFDVGWTLIYPRESMWEGLAAVGRADGTAMEAKFCEDLIHRLMLAHRENAVREFEAGAQYADSDAEFVALFRAMCGIVFGAAGSGDDHEELIRRSLDRFWAAENWRLYPDVNEGLHRLRHGGVVVGVVSNAASNLNSFLEEMGLAQRLDFAIVSAVEGTKKPDSRIFERALSRAGVEPATAVHVGDMYFEDVLGARAAGIRPLLMERGSLSMFPHYRESAGVPKGSVEVVRNLGDVMELLGVT